MTEQKKLSLRAQQLHAEALVWDNHGCLPQDLARLPRFVGQLARYRDAGVDFVSINIGDAQSPLDNYVKVAAFVRHWIAAHPGDYVLALRPGDIEQAKREGKLAIAFDIEGGFAVQHQISLLSLFYDLGVRWMLLAYNRNNALGGGCHDEDAGLTAKGREFIDEMTRIGLVPCCSHTGYRTAMDILERAGAPVIFSHSNPRALCDHPRNIPDELIRACAATGGVIGINGISLFLGATSPTADDMVRHIDYVTQLVGPEHVGLGLDYAFDDAELTAALAAGAAVWPAQLGYGAGLRIVEPEQIPRLTEGLLALGYRDKDVRAILGENFLRVARQSWR